VALCQIGEICLVQNFLERRIDGLKLINDACVKCLDILNWKPSPHSDLQKQLKDREKKQGYVDTVVSRITKDNFVFDRIFSKDHIHHELVTRSEKVLKVLFFMEEVTQENREFLWNLSVENGGMMGEEVFKCLRGAS